MSIEIYKPKPESDTKKRMIRRAKQDPAEPCKRHSDYCRYVTGSPAPTRAESDVNDIVDDKNCAEKHCCDIGQYRYRPLDNALAVEHQYLQSVQACDSQTQSNESTNRTRTFERAFLHKLYRIRLFHVVSPIDWSAASSLADAAMLTVIREKRSTANNRLSSKYSI